MSAKKEVVKKESEVATLNANDFVGFDEEQSSNDDILIPKILAMQGISQMVTDGNATFGDLRDSVTAEKLGDVNKPVKIVPFFVHKNWVVSKKIDGRWEFYERVPLTGGDTYRPYESYVDGVETKNELCFDLYCFVNDKLDMPYVVSFKGASKMAGRKIVTHFKKMLQAGKVPFAFTMNLIAKKQKNDKGTYIVMDLQPADPATTEAQVEASKWFKMIKDGMAKVNDTDLRKTESTKHFDDDEF